MDRSAGHSGAAPAYRVDRVGAAGAALALAGSALLPLFVLRANRIVAGTAEPLSAGGPTAWLLLAVAAGGLAAAVATRGSTRARIELGAAAAVLGALPWALAHAAATLTPDAASPARVSIGAGSWLAVAGAAALWFAATHLGPGRWWRAGAAALVAASWLAAGAWGGLARISLMQEYALQGSSFWNAVGTHAGFVAIALGLAVAIGVPLGVASARVSWVRTVALSVTGLIQTVPSLALLGLLVLPLAALGLPGIGPLPATIALTLYALLPVVRNTYLGLAGVDPAAVDAGRGMGMTPSQLLFRVEGPLALPLMIEGVRTAAVISIGIAAVVAFIGVNTLGVLVFTGWGYQADDLVLLGALPMVLMAVFVDVLMRAAGRLATSPGIRAEAQ